MLPVAAGVHDRIGRGRFELKVRFLARAMGVKNSEVAGIMASLEDQGLVSHDGPSITILDGIGLRRLACGCYDAMKRWYTLERLAAQPKAEGPHRAARVLRCAQASAPARCAARRRAFRTGTAMSASSRWTKKSPLLSRRTHTLRKYRAQLMANRAQLYRDILKRSNSRI